LVFLEKCDVADLINIAKEYYDMKTVAKMKQIVPEYKSNNSVYEKLDKKRMLNSILFLCPHPLCHPEQRRGISAAQPLAP